MDNIYEIISTRTGGNIYVGVVGPVRTGKSTLIKRIMETLVIPNIEDPYRRERARDELPQSGSGKTIMTSEPKFVPEEAVEIHPDGKAALRVRMIDSVGYMVAGAVGAEEDGVPRMVTTRPMEQCSSITFLVPSSAASVMGISWSYQGVVTILGEPSSSAPTAPLTIYPTESIIRTRSLAVPSGEISTASSGTNLGSEVIIVFPEPLWGSSSLARSRRWGSEMQGMTNSSMIRLINVDLPVRTGPTTPI